MPFPVAMSNSNPSENPGDEFFEQIIGLPNFTNHSGDPSDGSGGGGGEGGMVLPPPPPMMLQLGSGDAFGMGVGGGGYHGGAVFPLGLSLELEQRKGGGVGGAGGGGGGYLKVEDGGSAAAKRFHEEVVVDGRGSSVKNVSWFCVVVMIFVPDLLIAFR